MGDARTSKPSSRLREFIRREGPSALVYTIALHLLALTLLLNTKTNQRFLGKDIAEAPPVVNLATANSPEEDEEEPEPEDDEASSAPSSITQLPEEVSEASPIDVPEPIEDGEGSSPPPPEERVENPSEVEASASAKLLKAIGSATPNSSNGLGSGGNAAYQGRGVTGRLEGRARFGGSQQSEYAVARGLAWLAKVQDLRDPKSANYGEWNPEKFAEHYLEHSGETKRQWKNRLQREGAGLQRNRLGMSALVSLCFTGRGVTGDNKTYGKNLEAAIAYLLRHQDQKGVFHHTKERDSKAFTYDHALALMAVADFAALSKDQTHLPAIQMAVRATLEAQKKNGGWDYYPYPKYKRVQADMSITGFVIMALSSARAAGAKVDEDAIKKAIGFLRLATKESGESSYIVEYAGRKDGNKQLTAVNLLCRRLLGEAMTSPIQAKQLAHIASPLPNYQAASAKGSFGPYGWYYASMAMVMEGSGDDPQWAKFNAAMQRTLIRSQDLSGVRRGSWPPTTYHADEQGGRIYSTAMAILCLEVYYRYIPEHQKKAALSYRHLWK